MKTNKKYYILYKIIKDYNGEIIYCEDIANTNNEFGTFSNYKEIREYLQCNNRDIKNIITNNIDKLENIKTLRNKYFIIKE